ncbi:MAG: glycoside hydrolase family 2 TIM barrel-domain containing protein [Ferruginibacter sp.]
MINRKIVLLWLVLLSTSLSAQNNSMVLFDNDWRFHLGGAQSAEVAGFNDSQWRALDLPHDWSIEDLPGTQSPFDSTAISQVSGGFTRGGTGWYRKTFTLPADAKNSRIIIQFDGIYMNADIWINGQHAGNHPYGYTSFWYDITSNIKFGEINTIAIEVKNEGQNSRWYSGSGIYRHVWLKTTAPVHIAQWGAYITTPGITATSAKVNIKTKVLNESNESAAIRFVTRIINAAGMEVAKTESRQPVNAKDHFEFNQMLVVNNPQLWSCESPVQYKAITEIYVNEKLTGSEENNFGIRTISFDVTKGFQLNGKTIKLKGGCFHIDNGPLGSKAFDRAEVRKVELLKASGYNAIRCSHNPPSPAFLEACDSLGMLVIDESFDMWNYGKNPYDYHLYFKEWWKRDMESMLLRDRNHPSIIMWSIGNEIPEQGSSEGVQTAALLVAYVKSFDSTRPVTAAVNGLNPDKDTYFSKLDISGYNYAVGGDHKHAELYESDHQRIPGRIIFCSESYPLEAFGSWMAVEDHPYVIGDFVWTAFDYIGEASIGWLGYMQAAAFYPWNLAFCGDIDVCGWKRPQSYYRDVLWKKDQLSLFVKPPRPSYAANPNHAEWSKWNWLDAVPEWNWNGYESKSLEVSVYSSCETAELFLNGRSLGKKPTDRSTQFMALWSVPYQPGELKVIGYNGKKKVNVAALHTADAPVNIKLRADRTAIHADGQDLAYITVELEDANGFINPLAENPLHFSVEGNGTIEGVGNADPMSTESCQQPQRKAWKGKCLVIIKAGKIPGNIILKASSEGLASSQLNITTR